MECKENLSKDKWCASLWWYFQVWVNICAVVRVVVCGWFLLLQTGSFPSRAEWCHICLLCMPPSGWLCYYRLCFFMVFVDFCFWLWLYLFTDSTRCHTLLGTRPWFCICGRFQLGKTYLGAVAMAGPGGIPRLGLRYMHIGWSSIRHWLLVDWLLVIAQWSSIRFWLLIIYW